MARALSIYLLTWLTILTLFMTTGTGNVAKYQKFATNKDNFEEASSHTGYG